jgi:hypothetical protein
MYGIFESLKNGATDFGLMEFIDVIPCFASTGEVSVYNMDVQ